MLATSPLNGTPRFYVRGCWCSACASADHGGTFAPFDKQPMHPTADRVYNRRLVRCRVVDVFTFQRAEFSTVMLRRLVLPAACAEGTPQFAFELSESIS